MIDSDAATMKRDRNTCRDLLAGLTAVFRMDLGRRSVRVAHVHAAVAELLSCFAPREMLHLISAVLWTSIIFRVGNKLATHCF